MIDLYTASTFNGQRVSIMLEETGLDYTWHRINLTKGEQRRSEFLALNPSGRIPVIVDRDSKDSQPLVLTQSIAILQYLAEKTGQLLPKAIDERACVYEWMHFHAVDIGSTVFNAFYLAQRCNPKQERAAGLLTERIVMLYQFFDQQLAEQEFLAGADYSIADIATYPAVSNQQNVLEKYPHLQRWQRQLERRPAVARGMAVPAPSA